MMSLLSLELHGFDLRQVVYHGSVCRHPVSQNYRGLLTRQHDTMHMLHARIAVKSYILLAVEDPFFVNIGLPTTALRYHLLLHHPFSIPRGRLESLESAQGIR
jgi:hypothetical protein